MGIFFDCERHVTFPQLGGYGRFGNQLFQIAATIAHARRVGLKPQFPSASWDPCFLELGLTPRQFCLVGGEFNPESCYDAPWNYQPIPDEARALHGYFQSPRFWNGECPLAVPATQGEDIPLVAHVRRGDYLSLPDYHPPLSDSYYANFTGPSATPLLVCEEPVRIEGCEWAWGSCFSTNSMWEDFKLMLRARTLVLSNSSFALWAAYLGHAETVFYPVPWFGPALRDHDEGQLIPEATNRKEWVPVAWDRK